MSENNLGLWNSVEKTDPKYTKPAKLNGMQITAISPAYQKKIATNAFGPYGTGWGVVIGSEDFERYSIGETILLSYKAVLFYIHEGVRGEIPIAATEKLSYKVQNKNYVKIDDDADKKVKTSALTKGLSDLGFNADIFMGKFGDLEYRQLRETEERIEKSENFDSDQQSGFKEVTTWLEKEIKTLNTMKSVPVVTAVTNKIEQGLRDRLSVIKISADKINSMVGKLHKSANDKVNEITQSKGE